MFLVLLKVPLDEKIDLHQYSKYEATCTASIMLARPALCKGNTFLSNSHWELVIVCTFAVLVPWNNVCGLHKLNVFSCIVLWHEICHYSPHLNYKLLTCLKNACGNWRLSEGMEANHRNSSNQSVFTRILVMNNLTLQLIHWSIHSKVCIVGF